MEHGLPRLCYASSAGIRPTERSTGQLLKLGVNLSHMYYTAWASKWTSPRAS
jgi:hypothetical protein